MTPLHLIFYRLCCKNALNFYDYVSRAYMCMCFYSFFLHMYVTVCCVRHHAERQTRPCTPKIRSFSKQIRLSTQFIPLPRLTLSTHARLSNLTNLCAYSGKYWRKTCHCERVCLSPFCTYSWSVHLLFL